jgi:hypothetical protein
VAVFATTGEYITGLLSVTGNITGGNLIGVFANGNSNVNIPAANGNVNISAVGNANIVVVTGTGANITGTLNISGNTTFSGTGQRIQGDFSNATLVNRTVFQNKTANTLTAVAAIPNGTATQAEFDVSNSSDLGNASLATIAINSTAATIYSSKSGTGTYLPLTFSVGGSEVARMDTSLNFLVGRTSYSSVNSGVKGTTINQFGYISLETDYTSGGSVYVNTINAGSNATNQIYFYRNNTAAGLIVTSSSNQTSLVASSDYRLKNTITPLTTSGAFIDKLKPSSWIWNSSGVTDAGFIAHEAAEVTPNSVYGEKDAVDKDGNPVYQMMNASSSEIIANMVAELQDLRRRFAELQAEVNHLKNS